MLKRSAICLAVTVLASTASAKGTKYTLADLKQLNADGSYREAFEHIGDVPPSQRKADWIDVAAEAAAGALGTLDTDDGSTIAAIEQIDKQFPQLLKSAKYTKPRADLGYQGIVGCFEQTNDYWGSYGLENCSKLALKFVDKSGGDRALALKVAKVARKSMNAYGAVPFFKRTLGPKDTAACKDDDLKLAVVAGLGLPADDANAVESRAIMATCWDQLKDPILEEFSKESKDGYVHQNACSTLLAKKAISGLQAKQCTKK
ncbi:MAG TPA: hypothetical protein VL326_21755 [Kofleriaceae bacterium]|jgi:hypothetical protein|nr:hypothetical protein [Kofleriaceae bacterium]